MGNTLKNKRTSARRAATFLAALGVLVMSSGVALMVATSPANAAKAADCVPQAASTETIHHAAVTHTVHHAAVPAVDDQWFNFAPTDPGKYDGTPTWPLSDDGKWEAVKGHANGGPGDAVGLIHQGQGGGSWFYRIAGSPGVDAFDEVITDTQAFDETVNHPAVTCNVVSPPVVQEVSPPAVVHHATKAKAKAKAVTPTVVHAGLTSVSTDDVRGEQGLALMLAGMVMLFGAGGLGLRVRARGSRI